MNANTGELYDLTRPAERRRASAVLQAGEELVALEQDDDVAALKAMTPLERKRALQGRRKLTLEDLRASSPGAKGRRAKR